MRKIEAIIRKSKFRHVKNELKEQGFTRFDYHLTRSSSDSEHRFYRGVEYDAQAEERIKLSVYVNSKKIEDVLNRAGAKMSNVVRVRFYVTDISRGQEYIRAYSEWFKDIRPVITMAEIKALARPDHLVEIEAEAVIGSYLTSRLT